MPPGQRAICEPGKASPPGRPKFGRPAALPPDGATGTPDKSAPVPTLARFLISTPVARPIGGRFDRQRTVLTGGLKLMTLRSIFALAGRLLPLAALVVLVSINFAHAQQAAAPAPDGAAPAA